MLGIDDPYVLTAYVLCVASAVFCMAYGFANWNRGDQPPPPKDVQQTAEDARRTPR